MTKLITRPSRQEIDWEDLAPPCDYCGSIGKFLCWIKDHSPCPPKGKRVLCDPCSEKRGFCVTCRKGRLKVFKEKL